MQRLQWLFIFLAVLCCSCGLNQRETEIRKKQNEITQTYQKLLVWEQELTKKEQELKNRETRLDSTKKEIDSVAIHGPSIAGKWFVHMQCVETSCGGSAIGDLKTEQWYFTVTGNNITAKAYTGKNLTRIYNGFYTQSGLQLIDKSSFSTTTMEVTLRILSKDKMDGIREIKLPDCKTIYSITATRQ